MTVSGDPHSDPWLELLVDAVERCGNGSGQSVDEVRAELTASHPHLLPRFEQMLNASRQTSPLDLPMFRQPDVDPGGWPSGHRVGPWQIESLAGRGGMGEVYLARRADGAFERSVAIKRVARGNSGFDARFATERVLLARLDHPAIARLIDGGVDDQGQPYLVMEWVDGTGLPEWLRQPHPLSTRLDLLACLAEALIAAHRSLVVHRDLKPANVRVTSADLPKLLDFGIAKLLDDPEQDAGTTLGLFSPQYAAPEQLLGGGVSTLTDVHGFGLVMYEVLSGQPAFPHAARSLADRVRAICE
ncbi:MAG: serine/threonine-protein kinase, partial [Lysobacterales bacterium]